MTSYDFRADSYASWRLAMRYMALSVGSRQFASPVEMYWVESKGGIP